MEIDFLGTYCSYIICIHLECYVLYTGRIEEVIKLIIGQKKIFFAQMLCGFLGVCSLFRILPSKPPNFVPCFSKVWLHVTPGDGYLQFFSSGLLQQCFSLQSTHYFQFIHQLGPCSTTTYSCSGLCYYPRSFSNSFFRYLISCFPGPGSFNKV